MITDFEPPYKVTEHKNGIVEIEGGNGEGGTITLHLSRRDAIDLGDAIEEEVHD